MPYEDEQLGEEEAYGEEEDEVTDARTLRPTSLESDGCVVLTSMSDVSRA